MGKKIIIYDDDKDILLVTATILQLKGYEVMCKEECVDLESDLSDFEPSVILMDNRLPGMGGIKAVQYIKSLEAFKDIPVIFFSANSNVEELAKEAGADRLLKKPFDIATLHSLVEEVLSQQ
jgi:CheY-like chemotaxis protein